MDINYQISKNFNLSEFITSPTAIRKGYKEQMQPSDDVVDNIEALVINLLQPIRDLLPFGSIHITSGYRCKRLNDSVGSKDTSQHLSGMAADISYFEDGVKNNKKLFDTIKKSTLVYDQLIDEYNLSWVHVSYNRKGNNRKQSFKIK